MTMLDHDRPLAGWYPDPWRRAPLRWWDGARWTDATGETPVPATPPDRARQRWLTSQYDRLQHERTELVDHLQQVDRGLAEVGAELRRLEAPAARPAPAPALPPPALPGLAAPPPPRAAAVPATAPPGAGRAPRSARASEWRGATLGNLLLGLGTLLLTIAALVFATVAWPSLDDTQRALVLLAVTVICGAGTVVLHGRLHNTAQAISVLFVGFLLVDWLAARRAGLGSDMSAWWWWAAGFALAACAAVALAAGLRLVAQQVVGVSLAHVALVCSSVALAVDGAHPWFTATLAVAAIAVLGVEAEVVVGRLPGWRAGAVTSIVGACVMAGATAGAAVLTLAVEGSGLRSGVALAAVAAAPMAGRLVWPATRRHPVPADGLVGAAVAALLAGVTAGLAAWFPGWPTVTVLAAAALAVLVMAVTGPRPLARGATVAGFIALGVAMAAAAIPTFLVVLGSWALFGLAWRGPATALAASVLLEANGAPADAAGMVQGLWLAGVWACVGAASLLPVIASDRGRRPLPLTARFAVGGAATLIVLLAAVVGLSGSVLSVVLVMLGCTAVLVLVAVRFTGPERPFAVAPRTPMLLALASGLVALTWSVYERWCTVLALALLVAIAAAGAAFVGRTVLRSVLATVTVVLVLVLAPIVPAALDAPVAVIGLCLTVVGAIALHVAVRLLPLAGVDPVAPCAVSLGGLAIGLTAGLAGWSSGPHWTTVGAAAVAGAALTAVAGRTTDVLLRGAAVAAGPSLLIAAAGLAASAAGASTSTVGLVIGIAGAVVLVVATTVLRSADARAARVQRLVLVAVGIIGAAVGTGLAGTGTGDPITQGWDAGPWMVVATLAAFLVAASVAAWTTADEDLHLALMAVAAGAFILETALVPAASGVAPGWAAASATIGAGALLAGATYALRRRASDALAVQAVAFAGVQVALVASFAGWGGGARWATVVAFAACSAACLAASPAPPSRPVRVVLLTEGAVAAAVTAALAARAAGADGATTGLVLVGAGSAGVLIATWAVARRTGTIAGDARLILEIIGAATMAVGAAVSAADPFRLAEALTLAFPVLTAVGMRADRSHYRIAAAVVAVFATWAWLWVGGVRYLEAYTLPAAAGALVVSLLVRRGRDVSSWLAVGPALVLALFPSLALSLTEEGSIRPLALLVGGTAVLLVGVAKRLQAPVILGGIVVIVVSLDTLWPVVAQIPRWVVIAAVGSFFVWLGATIEHRLRQARDLGGFIGHLH